MLYGLCRIQSWIKHRFDSRSSFSPTVYHLPLISHYEDWGGGKVIFIYHRSWGQPKMGKLQKIVRMAWIRETEEWEVEEGKHICFDSVYSFRAITLLPLIQFHITSACWTFQSGWSRKHSFQKDSTSIPPNYFLQICLSVNLFNNLSPDLTPHLYCFPLLL